MKIAPQFWPCPEIRLLYGIKKKAAIYLPCKLIGKLIAALFFTPYLYSSLIFRIWSQFSPPLAGTNSTPHLLGITLL